MIRSTIDFKDHAGLLWDDFPMNQPNLEMSNFYAELYHMNIQRGGLQWAGKQV